MYVYGCIFVYLCKYQVAYVVTPTETEKVQFIASSVVFYQPLFFLRLLYINI